VVAENPNPEPEVFIVTAGTTPIGQPYPGLITEISPIPDSVHSILYGVQGLDANVAVKAILFTEEPCSIQKGCT
jgi:hypothetical protein